MVVLLIAVIFFGLSGAIGLVGAAIAPGGFRRNVASALAACIGAPLLIIASGIALGLILYLIRFVASA
jgi:hypothetical protein